MVQQPRLLRVSLWLLLRLLVERPLQARLSPVPLPRLVVRQAIPTRGHWRLLVLERLRPTVSV